MFKTLDYQTIDHETRLVWYDIEKETAKNVVIHGFRNKCFDSVICLNSLVSLAPYVGMDDRQPLKWVSVDEIKKHKQEIKQQKTTTKKKQRQEVEQKPIKKKK